MAWVPLAASGAGFTFEADPGGDAVLAGSVVSATSTNTGGWSLSFASPQRLRVTVQSYTAQSDFGVTTPAQFYYAAAGEDYYIANTAGMDSFEPSPFETVEDDNFQYWPATGSEWTISETFQHLIEVWGDAPEPEPDTECDEYGRSTRIYVSGYQRTRGHLARLTRGERRCLVVDFNGAIGLSRSIASVAWRTNAPHVHNMSGARIVGRTAVVDLDARGSGCGHIKVEATLDNGERCVQLVQVHVSGSPWFEGESAPAQGARSLTVTA